MVADSVVNVITPPIKNHYRQVLKIVSPQGIRALQMTGKGGYIIEGASATYLVGSRPLSLSISVSTSTEGSGGLCRFMNHQDGAGEKRRGAQMRSRDHGPSTLSTTMINPTSDYTVTVDVDNPKPYGKSSIINHLELILSPWVAT